MIFDIGVSIYDVEAGKSVVCGLTSQEMSASDIADQKANAIRLSENMIHELFEKYTAKIANKNVHS